MQSAELRAMQDKLSDVHAAIHKAFLGLPDKTATVHPALYYATNAAAASMTAALQAFYTLDAVLDQDAAPAQRGA